MRKKALLITGLVLFLVAAAGCTGDMASDEIASKAQEKYDSIESYRATMVMEAPGLAMKSEGGQRIEAEVAFEKPDKRRMEYVAPEEKSGDAYVTNGDTTWIYDESENTVRVIERVGEPPSGANVGSLVENMMEQYDVSLQGTEEVSGRDCYVLEMAPKEDGRMMQGRTVWIDKEHWFPVKMESEMTARNKTVTNTVVYRDMEFNVEISDGEFEFEVPENATVEEQSFRAPKTFDTPEAASEEAGFDVVAPGSLPDGYVLDTVRVFYFKDEPTVTLTYRNGGDRLTLSETKANRSMNPQLNGSKRGGLKTESVDVDGESGAYRTVGSFKSLTWSCGDLTLTLNGELDKDELIKMAESVECG